MGSDELLRLQRRIVCHLIPAQAKGRVEASALHGEASTLPICWGALNGNLSFAKMLSPSVLQALRQARAIGSAAHRWAPSPPEHFGIAR